MSVGHTLWKAVLQNKTTLPSSPQSNYLFSLRLCGSDFDAHRFRDSSEACESDILSMRSVRRAWRCLTLCPGQSHSSLWLKRGEEEEGRGGSWIGWGVRRPEDAVHRSLSESLKALFHSDGNLLQKEHSGLLERALHMRDSFLRARQRKEYKSGRCFQLEWLSEQRSIRFR